MRFFNLHTHQYSNNPSVLELVNQYPWEFDASIPNYSIGIHPWYIDENRLESDLKIIEEKITSSQCLAIGECGLDKRIDVPLSLQIKVFERQITLAEKYHKPLVLHIVSAFQELIEIKKQLKIQVPIIIHGFSKSKELAEQLIDQGIYLSFGKYLLQKPELESVFQSLPNHHFFLETDTIQKNIEEVYALAAKYKSISVTDLVEITQSNFQTIFKTNF